MRLSELKTSGACTVCDAMVFRQIVAGVLAANTDAVRITFMLYDGTRADMTFCETCAGTLTPELYIEIWRKCMRSWLAEIGCHEIQHKNWFPQQFFNGLLVELGRFKFKDIEHGYTART